MKFYRLTYKAEEKLPLGNENGENFSSLFSGMPYDIMDSSDGNAVAYLSGWSGMGMSIDAAVDKGDISGYTEKIAAYLPPSVSPEPEIREISCERFNNYLRRADRFNEFDEDEIRVNLGIERIYRGVRGASLSYDEKFIGECSAEYCSSALDKEISRINRSADPGSGYNPVHYIIGGNNHESRENMLGILLNELSRNGRLSQTRYTTILVREYLAGVNSMARIADEFLKIGSGGAVVFDIEGEICGSDGRMSYVNDLLSEFCRTAKKYKDNTLCIFLLPDNSEVAATEVSRLMPETTFVKITEDPMDSEKSRKYLSSLAKSDNIRGNRNLYKDIDKDGSYCIDELRSIYDAWYKKTVVCRNFPAYADVIESGLSAASGKEEKPAGDAYEELMAMTGLHEAKKVISEAIDYFRAQKLFADSGFGTARPSMHMVFTGAPGTAKTSVARLFAKIMKDNGILSSGAFVEVGRGDLVGQYVGWTANIVKGKFRQAKGGVLFIDEAYSLVDGRKGSFGDEAINTIVQEMENNREDIIVIFAGYSHEMEEFLDKNPGLRSRIAFHIPFADYSAPELCDIAELMAKNEGLTLGNGVKEKLLPIMEAALMQDDFGNGRFVRNLMEKARMKQAGRLVRSGGRIVTREQVSTLLPEDFEMPATASGNRPCRNAIGF